MISACPIWESQILYDMFNKREDVYCERVYSPWLDLECFDAGEENPRFLRWNRRIR